MTAKSFTTNLVAAMEESDRYGSLKKNNQTTEDIAQIVNATCNGQIDTLFMTQNSSAWGTFDLRYPVMVEAEAVTV
ncbi:MAG: hypothetical protein AAGM45_03790 [Cyanobacteria bacterium J06588_5]